MKPNIVFITSDQQRRDSLGIYGCRYVSTPNLDRLGSQATVYEHCYCNAPVCTPSRACMMTGKTMPGHGVYNLFDILPENEKMLPYYLSATPATALIFMSWRTSPAFTPRLPIMPTPAGCWKTILTSGAPSAPRAASASTAAPKRIFPPGSASARPR